VVSLGGTSMTYRGTILKSRDGIPRPVPAPPGLDLAAQARIARRRFYPVTVAYVLYAAIVLPLGLRARPLAAAAWILAGVSVWTLVEYLVHRYVLHGRFPDGPGPIQHAVHRFLDTAHGDHHLRPWDGLHINGGFDSIPVAIVLALLSFLAPLPTAPVFIATVLVSYVAEEWVHYSVHFHQFKSRYFAYIRKHHLYHHSGRGSTVAFGLSSGIWDGPLGTPIARKRQDSHIATSAAAKNDGLAAPEVE